MLWYQYYQILPKAHRYSLGVKTDNIFTEIIGNIANAIYLKKSKKLPFVGSAIRKTDVLKIFLLILYETGSLKDKQYIALSLKVSDFGRMLGGWRGQLEKQNSPKK